MRFNAEPYRHDSPRRTGVLLTNLGTPDEPTPTALRRYLAEFLSDPRVVEAPRWLWWLVLHGVILRIRPRRVAKAYAGVWSEQGSPLLAISKRQAAAVQARLGDDVPVALGMRYGNPSLRAGLEQLRARGADHILVLPLYPQYSASTSASTLDGVNEVLRHWRRVPDLRFISHYHDDPGYIGALAASIRDYWEEQGRRGRLLFSFHGIPQRYFDHGDPYHCECHKTARLVAETLQLESSEWALAFQSRFGREEWLKPYTDKTLIEWAQQGVEEVQVVCPGFSADCLETLEEIAVENRDNFLGAGGKRLDYIPALNDRDDHIDALVNLIRHNLQGWPQSEADGEAEARIRRARALGAEH